MAETLKLQIVTPEAIVFSEDVHMVTIPAVEGEMGIYPQHVRLITQVVPGEIIVTRDGQERYLAVGEGLVEVTANQVSIVTDMAIPAENIDEARAAEARARRFVADRGSQRDLVAGTEDAAAERVRLGSEDDKVDGAPNRELRGRGVRRRCFEREPGAVTRDERVRGAG